MGFWHPMKNLKDYVSQHPPGVTFFLCLLILALSFICLGSYVNSQSLPNPDNIKDWNHLMLSLSRFHLCMTANATSTNPTPVVEQRTGETLSANHSKGPLSLTKLYLKVPLKVTHGSASQSLIDMGLHTTLNASQLGLIGYEAVNMTVHLISQGQNTGKDTLTCLSISAPTQILPVTPLPPACPANENILSHIQVVPKIQLSTGSKACYSLQSTYDPTLTEMLTKEQRGVAGRHLLEVSVCLFALCVLLCLSVILTRSLACRYHGNGLDVHREPLLDS